MNKILMRADLCVILCVWLSLPVHASANTTVGANTSNITTSATITHPLVFFTLKTMMPLYPLNYTMLDQYQMVLSRLVLVKFETITMNVGTITVDGPLPAPGATLSVQVIFRVETWGDTVGVMNTLLSDDFQFLLDYFCYYVPLPEAKVVKDSVSYMNIGPPPAATVGVAKGNARNATSGGACRHRHRGRGVGMLSLAVALAVIAAVMM